MSSLTTGLRVPRPRSVGEAIAIRVKNPDSRYLAGGTDLIVNMRRRINAPHSLIDLAGVDELARITTSTDGLCIGTGVTVAALAHDGAIAPYHALVQAAEAIAGPGHRNIATVGGNLCQDTRCIYYNQSEWWRSANDFCLKLRGTTCHVAPQGQRCHAAYSGDLAPALLVHGAEIDVAAPKGRRRMPLSELYVEDGRAHLSLAEEELVVAVRLPATPPPSAYAKIRLRGAIDFPLAGVGAALTSTDGKIGSLRVALTGTNSRPFLLAGTNSFADRAIDDTLLTELERLVQKQVQPMRTTTASSNYRRMAAAALARRLVAQLGAQTAS